MRVTRELPLSAIKVDRYPFDRVLEFVAAYKNGVVPRPIHVKLDPTTGVFSILDGRHRFMAYKLMGKKTIPAVYGVPEITTPSGTRETLVHRYELTKGLTDGTNMDDAGRAGCYSSPSERPRTEQACFTA